MLSWKSLFDKETIAKGMSYCSQGKAKRLAQEDYGYSVQVRGDRNYRVEIHLDYSDRISRLVCGCSEAANGGFCAHMAAALHYTEDCLLEKLYLNDLLENRLVKSAQADADAHPAPKSADTDNKKKRTPAGENARRLQSTYREGIEELSAMQEAEQKERTAASEGAGGSRASEAYRYFHVENFRRGISLSKDIQAKALRLLSNPDIVSTVKVGFFDLRDYYSFGMHYVHPEDNSEDALHIQAKLTDRRGSRLASMFFDQDGPIRSQCEDWSCMISFGTDGRVGHKLCVHEAALLIAVEEHLKANPVGDATSRSGMELFDAFGLESSAAAHALPARSASLSLIPQIRLDSYGDWSVLFKVGSGRMYKVPKLQEFCHDVTAKKDMTCGSSTVLHLSEDAFNESGKKWLAFLRQAIHILAMFSGLEREATGNVYFYDSEAGWNRITDRLPLSGEILDRLFETAGDEPVAWEQTGDRRQKGFVTMKDANYKPALAVKPSFSGNGRKEFIGLEITGKLPNMLHGSAGSYFLDGDTFYRIPRKEETALLPLVRSADKDGEIRISIGRRRLTEFWRKILPQLQEIAAVNLENTELIEQYIPAEPAFLAYLDLQDGIVLCRPEVYYGSLRHTPFDVYAWREHKKTAENYRDKIAEESMILFLERYLPEHDVEAGLFLSATGEASLFEFLEHGLSDLMEFAEVRASERFRSLKVRRRMHMQIGVSLDSGLMDLTLTSEDLTPEELMEVLNGYRKKAKYVRLKSGDFIQLEDNEAIAQMNELLNALHLAPKSLIQEKLQVPAFRALYLDRMLESMQDTYTNRDRHFKSLVKEFKTVSDADFAVPDFLKGTLRKYQITGYRWLRTLDAYGFGGILADDMGLGKTLQAIAVLLATKLEAPETGPSIIVCPASLVYNWQDELSRFAPELSAAPVVGTAAERRTIIAAAASFDVLVTSYDYLKRDFSEYEDLTFRFAIVDEAQYIKNQATIAAKSVKMLKAKTHFALTGTPIENKLSDLWSIFDFLMPGFLYSYSEFRSDLETPIVKSGDEKARERLHRMVAPFILRRTKKEVLTDLPDKLEEIRYAGLLKGGEQQKLYNASVVKMKKELRAKTEEDFSRSRIQILSELTRIRQICCDPQLLMEDYHADSAKREACLDLIRSAVDGEHKILLFSQFTSMLELLEGDLKAEGIAWYKITGSTPKEERAKLVKAFNQDDTPVFLISLKAGGTGLNLTGADVVIHYDPWWNVAAQNQATDRAHRIGQTKVVTVYRLILKDTIEDRILELQEQKRALAEDLLSAEAVSSSSISRDELLALLG